MAAQGQSVEHSGGTQTTNARSTRSIRPGYFRIENNGVLIEGPTWEAVYRVCFSITQGGAEGYNAPFKAPSGTGTTTRRPLSAEHKKKISQSRRRAAAPPRVATAGA